MKRARTASKKRPPRRKLPEADETLARAKGIECRKHAKMSRQERLLLASIALLVIILMALSMYADRIALQVSIASQASECFSVQHIGSSAEWSGGSIAMVTGFETIDPCYAITSIDAEQKGDIISVDIRTESGGLCVQCFGYRRVEYELASPRMSGNLRIDVYVDGVQSHQMALPLPA